MNSPTWNGRCPQMTDLSKTDHAEQMAAIRARVEHNAACVAAGKTLTHYNE